MSSEPLTQCQMEDFDREGWLVLDRLFEEDALQPVVDEITSEVTARARKLVETGELSQTYEEAGFERQLARITEETEQVALEIWNGSLAGPAIFHLIRNPALLEIAEQLCGPELIASSVYRLRPKVPGHRNGPVPWHQDSGYFEPFCDAHMVLTVWLPLVDATEENGCMWVLPRVHKGEIYRHQGREGKWYLEIPDEALPPSEPVCVPVPKGGVLLLTNRTPHASFENTCNVVRWSMDLRYQSAALPTNAGITRLPGETLPDERNGVPPACYPPEADFLVRSRARPNEVVSDPAVFRAIRENHLSLPVTSRW